MTRNYKKCIKKKGMWAPPTIKFWSGNHVLKCIKKAVLLVYQYNIENIYKRDNLYHGMFIRIYINACISMHDTINKISTYISLDIELVNSNYPNYS